MQQFATDAVQVPPQLQATEDAANRRSDRCNDHHTRAGEELGRTETFVVDSRGVVFVIIVRNGDVTAKVMVMPNVVELTPDDFLKFNLDQLSEKTNGLRQRRSSADISGSAAYGTPIVEDGRTRPEARSAPSRLKWQAQPPALTPGKNMRIPKTVM